MIGFTLFILLLFLLPINQKKLPINVLGERTLFYRYNFS